MVYHLKTGNNKHTILLKNKIDFKHKKYCLYIFVLIGNNNYVIIKLFCVNMVDELTFQLANYTY